MAILESVRKVFTRRRDGFSDAAAHESIDATPIADVKGTQAEALFQALQDSEDARRANSHETDHARYMPDGQPTGRESSRAMVTVEPKPSRKTLEKESSATKADLPSLIRRIDQHMEGQSERAEQLLTLMERMPTALESIPEMNRNTHRMLETINDAQHHARQRDVTLNSTLDRIGSASERHTEVLGLLQQQLDASEQATIRISDTLGEFRQVLSDMSSSTSQQVDVLSRMARATEKRELRITTTLARTQKWMIAAMIFCGLVTLAALGVAVVVLLVP